ncbi:hypothetical protein ACFYYR_25115 [Streptomyces sp. NPDC001922]|uniref:hypothetical protein n=1 Tax=Streptomyces sp. NPDC001922 TaxID=3364624 RepID=UPI0036875449
MTSADVLFPGLPPEQEALFAAASYARYGPVLPDAAVRLGLGDQVSSSIVLMSDRRVAAIPLQECGEDLADVRAHGLNVDDPEESAGACYTDAPGLSAQSRTNRATLGNALSAAGLINDPSEFWHWSFGDRYWAMQTQQRAALYGPV